MKQTYLISIAIIAGLAFYSCAADNEPVPTPVEQEEEEKPQTEKPDETSKPDESKDAEWIPSIIVPSLGTSNAFILSDEETAALNGLHNFSFNLISSSCGENDTDGNGNFCISPISAALCLSMWANSVDDSTRDQIVSMMGADKIETVNELMYKLQRYLPSDITRAEVCLANSVWYTDKYQVSKQYGDFMTKQYGAAVMPFSDTNTLSRLLDEWCNVNTEGMIPSFPAVVTPETDVLWVNALYFADRWSTPFEKESTTISPFHGTNHTTDVEMMNSTEILGYAEFDGYKAVNKYFENREYACYIIVPDDAMILNKNSFPLSLQTFTAIKNKMEDYEVTFSMPKFELETNADLLAAYQNMGLNTQNTALSGMGFLDGVTGNANARQTSSIATDEDGARLAAISTVGWGSSLGYTPVYPKVEFKIDRPFIFIISNRVSGAIMMAGRVCNLPNAK